MNSKRKVLFEKTKMNNLKTYRVWIEGFSRPAYVQCEEIRFIGSSIIFLNNEEMIKIVPQNLATITLTTEEEKNEHEQS